MSFNLLPKFLSVITGPEERQLNEGGFNAVDNCGPAAGSVLMQVLGYQDIEPQAWTDYEYGPTYRGGETYQALNDFIASHYPNPPTMTIESPADQLAAIDSWGKAGLLVIGLFWSNSGAQFQPYRTGIGHFALILGYDGATVTVWNPEWGVQDLTLALFKGASQNLYDVCHRPVSAVGATAGSEVIAQEAPMTPSEKYAHIRIQFLIAEPDVAPDNALIGQWASKIQDDGNNVDAVIQTLWSTVPNFAAYRNRLSSLLKAGSGAVGAAGPPGPPGPAGPPGPVGPAAPPHKHNVAGTAEFNA